MPLGAHTEETKFEPVTGLVKTTADPPVEDTTFVALALKSKAWGMACWVYKKLPQLDGDGNIGANRTLRLTAPEASTGYTVRWYNTWEGAHVAGKDEPVQSTAAKELVITLLNPFPLAAARQGDKCDGYDAFCTILKP